MSKGAALDSQAGGGPERIVMPARQGAQLSPKPPVRIFVGSEPAQYRAERVFLWSIERVRDPGRVYEVHLMKDLPGFRRWFWTTGFTNYRFAVPQLAGQTGRAIYNDVDQIYLADPAELFDRDLEGHGFLAVSQTDTSVMLLDCERMAAIWSLDMAQGRRKRALIRTALDAGAFGPLEPEWNARDDEAIERPPKLIHHTILHKQPWRPFPERFYYQPNPHSAPWFALERDAERSGFHVFGPDQPSCAFERFQPNTARAATPRDATLDDAVEGLVERAQAASLLDLVPGDEDPCSIDSPLWGVARADREGLRKALTSAGTSAGHDGVVCLQGLDELPPEDLPWAVEELFRRANRFVFASVDSRGPAPRRRVRSPEGTVGRREWWSWAFESAARRHPTVHWEIALHRRRGWGRDRTVEFLHGGPRLESTPPTVWLISDHKPGHRTQALGLAEQLGWPLENLDVSFGRVASLPNFFLRTSLVGIHAVNPAQLTPPWPDLVIATGRGAARTARWVRAQSLGRTRAVVMGRMGGFHGEHFDLAVAPAYSGLYPHPRRIETSLPITNVREPALEAAAAEWKSVLERAPDRRIALLVGGSDPMYEFTPEVARRMGADVAKMAKRIGGSVFVTTSRRTRSDAADALADALGETAVLFHRWRPGDDASHNPYMGFLALADTLVVTGESASMLAEACASAKPVFIYPLPECATGFSGRALRVLRTAADAVAARAFARPVNRRGVERPQKGLERLCASAIARGLVPPFSEIRRMQEVLTKAGLARMFDASEDDFESHDRRSLYSSEVMQVADAVRELVGVRTLR